MLRSALCASIAVLVLACPSRAFAYPTGAPVYGPCTGGGACHTSGTGLTASFESVPATVSPGAMLTIALSASTSTFYGFAVHTTGGTWSSGAGVQECGGDPAALTHTSAVARASQSLTLTAPITPGTYTLGAYVVDGASNASGEFTTTFDVVADPGDAGDAGDDAGDEMDASDSGDDMDASDDAGNDMDASDSGDETDASDSGDESDASEIDASDSGNATDASDDAGTSTDGGHPGRDAGADGGSSSRGDAGFGVDASSEAGADASNGDTDSDSGCSCSEGRASNAPLAGAFGLIAIGALVLRRKRRG